MRNFISSLLALTMICGLGAIVAGPASAHEIKPVIAEVLFDADGRFTVEMDISAEAVVAGIEPGLSDTNDSDRAEEYDALRALSSEDLATRFRDGKGAFLDGFELRFDGQRAPLNLDTVEVPPVGDVRIARDTRLVMAGVVPPGAEAFTWHAPEIYGGVALKLKRAGDSEFTTAWLQPGELSEAFPMNGLVPARSTIATLVTYVEQGFIHIVPKGLDHILFVLGLFLLSTHMRPLLVQVSCFTVAHSITLAMSLYGVINLPPEIVEPLIALSIAYVAVENILMRRLSPWRPVVVFMFGLLHGMGFAGVLTELGLPRDQFLTALIGFNVGVEGGQLFVILCAWLATAFWGMSESTYRRGIVIPVSACIALVGLYWTVERALL